MLSFSNSELIKLILIWKKEPNCLLTNLELDSHFEEIITKNIESLLKYQRFQRFSNIFKNSVIEDIKYECGLFLYSKIDKLNTEKAKDKRRTINFFTTISLAFIQQELCEIIRKYKPPKPAKKEYRCIDEPWEESLFVNI